MPTLSFIIYHPSVDATLINVPVPASETASFDISIEEDVIALEYDDSFILKYTHDIGAGFVELVEAQGEFIRDTAIVKIIDNDGKIITSNHIIAVAYDTNVTSCSAECVIQSTAL